VNRFLVWLGSIALIIGLGGPSNVTAQTSSDQEYLEAVSTIYAGGTLAGFVRDWCDLHAPQFKDASTRALEAWRRTQNLPEIESRFAALVGGRRVGIDQKLEGSRRAFYDKLDANFKDPVADCQDLAGLLGKNFNLKAEYADAYRIIAASPPAPNIASPSASGTLYTPAQISGLFEETKRKTTGSNAAKFEAAKQAVVALGVIHVTGQPSNGNVMGYEIERGRSRASVSCLFEGDDDFEDLGLIGKTVVVRGRVTSYSLSFIQMRDCAVVNATAGLKKSSLPEDPGLRLSAAAFSAGVNKGLKPSQIDGVYLEQNTGFGVGGMVIIRYDPVLMLKDGWAYDGWKLTPADLDVSLSRKLEPESWRRFERKGDQIRVQEQDGTWSKFEKWSQVGPAKPGDALQGAFSSIGGGGNTAIGGNTMIAVISSYTFKKDGTFKTDKAVSASGGNEATDPSGPPGVVATSQASSSGTYKLDGYTLELRFSNGRLERRAFLWFNEKKKDSIFIDGTAFLI
jgi:hypothetical protein